MSRYCKKLACIIFFFVGFVNTEAKESDDYTYLYLYYMELSEEVRTTVDEFLQSYPSRKMKYHYLEITVLRIETEDGSYSVLYRIKWINSPDKEKLVVNEELFSNSWYRGIQPYYVIVGYSYYKNHFVVVKKKYDIDNVNNPFIKMPSDLFANRFLYWKHEVNPAPDHGGYGLCFKVRKNNIIRYPM